MVVTRAYTSNSRVRIRTGPRIIGNHLRRRLLTLKLIQKEVGAKLGVTEASIYNWEGDDSKPSIEYMPAIIKFLGNNPLPSATTLAGRLTRHRTSLGLLQSVTAGLIGVDRGTSAR